MVFMDLKAALIKLAAIGTPRRVATKVLFIDTPSYEGGAMLLQEEAGGNEKPARVIPLGCISRKLTDAETHYTVT